jgi:phage FluMu protein gp41
MLESRTITLPSGKIAVVRPQKGRDALRAARIADPAKEPIAFLHAAIAQVATIDGKPLVAEDVAELYQADINALAAAMIDEKFFLDPASSSGSSNAGSGTPS